MRQPSIDTYGQFWLFYLREHSRPWTRRWHIAGTLLAIGCLIAAIVLANPWLLLAAAFAGYGPAWIVHLLIEKIVRRRGAIRSGHCSATFG